MSGDAITNLFAALIGGLFTLAGGWAALRGQLAQESRGVARALAAELKTAQNMMNQSSVGDFYQNTLNFWKENGTVTDQQMLIDMFDHEPQDVLPVYYSMASKIGLLPASLATMTIEYHAKAISVNRIIVRFFGKRTLPAEQVQALAASVEVLWKDLNAMRPKLIEELTKFGFSRDQIDTDKNHRLANLNIKVIPVLGRIVRRLTGSGLNPSGTDRR